MRRLNGTYKEIVTNIFINKSLNFNKRLHKIPNNMSVYIQSLYVIGYIHTKITTTTRLRHTLRIRIAIVRLSTVPPLNKTVCESMTY